MARNRWHRFGYACVNFGSPLSLKRWLAEERIDLRALSRDERSGPVTALAERLMGEIARVIPVVPVPLVARAFLSNPDRAWSEIELKASALDEIRQLEDSGAHVYVPRGDQDYAFDVGLRMLTLRRLVVEEDGLFTPVRSELPVLEYYANSIEHLFPAGRATTRVAPTGPGIFAAPLRSAPPG
jgi:glycerol-3-phosphate O-acyltransferase